MSGGLDLADLWREVDRADVHGLREALVDEVHDEDAGLGDIAGGVLRGGVRLVLEPEHDQRRLPALATATTQVEFW